MRGHLEQFNPLFYTAFRARNMQDNMFILKSTKNVLSLSTFCSTVVFKATCYEGGARGELLLLKMKKAARRKD